MVGGLVLAAIAAIYVLVLRRALADSGTAEMARLESEKSLRNEGERALADIDKALATGEGHQRYVDTNALAKDDTSVAQYEMAAELLQQSSEIMERYRASIIDQLHEFTEGDNPRLAYVGRSKKLKLVDDSYLTEEQKADIRHYLKGYNDKLAVSPLRSLRQRLARVKPVEEAGRMEELHRDLPPDQAPPVLDPAAFDEALAISVPRGIRAVLGQRREKRKSFQQTSLYERTRKVTEKAQGQRNGQNGGKGKGPSA